MCGICIPFLLLSDPLEFWHLCALRLWLIVRPNARDAQAGCWRACQYGTGPIRWGRLCIWHILLEPIGWRYSGILLSPCYADPCASLSQYPLYFRLVQLCHQTGALRANITTPALFVARGTLPTVLFATYPPTFISTLLWTWFSSADMSPVFTIKSIVVRGTTFGTSYF